MGSSLAATERQRGERGVEALQVSLTDSADQREIHAKSTQATLSDETEQRPTIS